MESDNYREQIGRCRAEIQQALGRDLPATALVLGSGFQSVVAGFQVVRTVSYAKLPGFPQPGVAGHAGALLLAELAGWRCLICSGRAHFYEGFELSAVTFPTRMLAECGVKELILTNAAGGINPAFEPGDFMLVADHINFMGVNPLRNDPEGPRFLDVTRAYSPALRTELQGSARRARVRLHSGVYLAVSGPSYETPAEIRAFRQWGADAVGMSTVPEVLMARSRGMEVAALSCITNPAAGLRREELSHEEVLQTGRQSSEKALRLLTEFARARTKNAVPAEGESLRKHLKKSPRRLGSQAK